MNQETIVDLQSYFDGRSRLNKVITAIKLYSNDTNNPSLFYAYVDGFKNKRTVNVPIDPADLLPILEKYVRNIENEIMGIANKSSELEEDQNEYEVIIENENDLANYITDYANRYPETYISLESIKKRLSKAFSERTDPDIANDYHIEVCSDWQDKIYVFSFRLTVAYTIYFKFEEIYKL